MADAWTGTSALSNQVLTAYDRVAFFALRANPVFAALATVKPGQVTSPGNPVKFTFWGDLTESTTPLSETVDPDAVALSDSQVTVTPKEYGKAILVTIKIRTDTFLAGFDAGAANIVAWNMTGTLDLLARDALDGGTNVDYITGSTEIAQVATSVITAAEVRKKHAELMGDNVMPIGGDGIFAAEIHPDVSYDLKDETGDGAWISPAQYVNTDKIYRNEIGQFGGFRFMETSRAKVNADGGSSTVDTYTTYFHGAEALGQAVSIPPHMVLGPVTDKFNRFQPLGWYGYLGFDTIREAALRRLISASSIGDNA